MAQPHWQPYRKFSGNRLGDRQYPFEPGDVLVRRITKWNRNSTGRPTRAAFRGRDQRTSVYLKRLLESPDLPGLEVDDLIALFPVAWIDAIELTKTPLVIEFTGGAHFEILGHIHIEFADHLRDNAELIDLPRWIDLFRS